MAVKKQKEANSPIKDYRKSPIIVGLVPTVYHPL